MNKIKRNEKRLISECIYGHIPIVYTQPAYNFKPLSTREFNAIWLAFSWRAGGGPLLDVNWVPSTCSYNFPGKHTFFFKIAY